MALQEIAASVPELTEEQLETMYESLMLATPQDLAPPGITASQAPALPDPAVDAMSRRARVDSLVARLQELENDVEASGEATTGAESTDSSALLQGATQVLGSTEVTAGDTASPARAIIEYLKTSLDTLPISDTASLTSATFSSAGEKLPRGLLSRAEYEDLILACVSQA